MAVTKKLQGEVAVKNPQCPAANITLEGLFNLTESLPPTLRYEVGVIVAGGDFVMVHGRFSGFGEPVNWIAADIVRVQDGLLIEHWDVIQDEVTHEQSKSGLPMFGDKCPQ
jgi:predicted SnoaL-like aldol condensation-catalyzing enzyme